MKYCIQPSSMLSGEKKSIYIFRLKTQQFIDLVYFILHNILPGTIGLIDATASPQMQKSAQISYREL